jgi:hypothetical protein
MKLSLRNLFRTPAVVRRPARTPRRTRPQLEALEDRAVPTVGAFPAGLNDYTFRLGPPPPPNEVFVLDLYNGFLHRSGDVNNPNDAGGWIAQLNAGRLSAAQVASGIVHSAEALGRVVDGLYTELLNRSADAAGRAGFLSFLERGGTVEEVITAIASSKEFAGLTKDSDTGFVQSVYRDLLGRPAGDAEVRGGLTELAAHGRSGLVHDVLNSVEYRTDEVNQMYGVYFKSYYEVSRPQPSPVINLYPELLRRDGRLDPTPSAAEVSAAVNSGQGILALETSFAASPEYFSNALNPRLLGL